MRIRCNLNSVNRRHHGLRSINDALWHRKFVSYGKIPKLVGNIPTHYRQPDSNPKLRKD